MTHQNKTSSYKKSFSLQFESVILDWIFKIFLSTSVLSSVSFIWIVTSFIFNFYKFAYRVLLFPLLLYLRLLFSETNNCNNVFKNFKYSVNHSWPISSCKDLQVTLFFSYCFKNKSAMRNHTPQHLKSFVLRRKRWRKNYYH